MFTWVPKRCLYSEFASLTNDNVNTMTLIDTYSDNVGVHNNFFMWYSLSSSGDDCGAQRQLGDSRWHPNSVVLLVREAAKWVEKRFCQNWASTCSNKKRSSLKFFNLPLSFIGESGSHSLLAHKRCLLEPNLERVFIQERITPPQVKKAQQIYLHLQGKRGEKMHFMMKIGRFSRVSSCV